MITSIFSLPLLYGLLAGLAALPVAIHLINMLRHRRVKWAAMDFLLQSYKKNRNWVWLKQLLLLLLRVGVMLLLVLMLGQVGCRNENLAELLGSQTTHHYVLLDDSYSMSDRAGDTRVFDRARQAIRLIAQKAGTAESQRITLIRYSRAMGNEPVEGEPFDAKSVADINSEIVDMNFGDLLDKRLGAVDVSELSVDPVAALRIVSQLVSERGDETSHVYLVTDFRGREWDSPADIESNLSEIHKAGAEIQLVDCVDKPRTNLAIVDVKATEQTRAAGVAFGMEVSVRNYGNEPATNVQVTLKQSSFDIADEALGEPTLVAPEVNELPTVFIENIKPGQTETRQFSAYFKRAGKHVVEASLTKDPVMTDNRRWAVIDVPVSVPVLLIDGSPSGKNAYHLGSAFSPGKFATGIRPDVQTFAFLRDAKPEELKKFQTIYLLDVDLRGDERAIRNLEQFVESGGGLAIFAGENLQLDDYNRNLYRDGEGVMPLPLERVHVLPEETQENQPDIVADDHPVFSLFRNERNSFVQKVVLNRYLKPPADWAANDDPNVTVAARSRVGDPIAVQREFGKGRVLAVLTSAAPRWNNWATNPTFVVMLLELQSHLGSSRFQPVPHTVGTPLEVELKQDQFKPDVAFVVPDEDAEARPTIDKVAKSQGSDDPTLLAALAASPTEASQSGETSRSGIYEAWSFRNSGTPEVSRWAMNVETTEGDLALSDRKALISRFAKLEPNLVRWEDFDPDPTTDAGFGWARLLLVVLIVVLLLEQFVAYALSYHPARRGAAS